MRAPKDASNAPLFEHTLMPTHMRARFSPAELADIELAEPFAFTKGVRTIRMPGRTFVNPHVHGTLLFDLEADPEQEHPIVDTELLQALGTTSLISVAAMATGMIPADRLRALADELAAL
jgi:hypothetical protein